MEFAIILPALVIIAFGCVDFGRFAYSYIAVTNAARAGASYGIMNNYTSSTYGTWVANITQAAKDEITSQGQGQLDAAIPGQQANPGNWQVTVSASRESTGLRRVQVLVSYPFYLTPPSRILLGIPNPITIERQVEMRLIR